MKKYERYSELVNKQQLSSLGFDVIETYNFNVYELTLLKATGQQANFMENAGLSLYSIGFSRDTTDFTDLDDQRDITKSLPSDLKIKKELKKAGDKIKKWQNKYGSLIANSFNDRKTRFYKTILKKMNINFEMIDINFGGQEYQVLEIKK